jgi:hypothetical protein
MQGADWRERIDEMAEAQEYADSKGVELNFSKTGGGSGSGWENWRNGESSDGEN